MARARVTGRIGRVPGAVAAGLLAALVVASCSGHLDQAKAKFDTVGDRIDGGAGGSSAATEASGRGSSADRAGQGLPKGPAAGTQLDARDVVYTGTLTVRVSAAPKAAEAARAVADDAGGHLASQRADLAGDRRVVVVLRVPAGSFDEAMAAIAALGDVQVRKVDSDDVTDQVVDLRERLANARTSAARLRELLAAAENINNVIAIEDRLTQRETEIEQLTGQLEVLKDQAAYSTITATFTERVEPEVSKDLPGPVASARAGGVAFVNVAVAVIAALAFLLPFLVVGGVAWLLVRRLVRRRRRDGDGGPGGAAVGAVPVAVAEPEGTPAG